MATEPHALETPVVGKEMQDRIRGMFDDAVVELLPQFVENVEKTDGEVPQSITVTVQWVPPKGEEPSELVFDPKFTGGKRKIRATARYQSSSPDGKGKRQLCLFPQL